MTTIAGAGWRRAVIPVFLGLVTLLFSARALRHLDHWGIQDWESSVFYTEAARVVLLEHGQLPLWNPWFCGGTPLLARPEATCAGPAFLLPLLLGGFTGIRLLIPVYLALGLFGAYRLGRHLGMGAPAALLTALIFMAGGPFTSHLVVGNTWILPMGLMPWAFLWYLRATTANGSGGGWRNAAVVTGLLLALMWLGGAPYLVVMTGLLLALYSGLGVLTRAVRPLAAGRALLMAGAVAAGVSAVQLIPCLEYMSQFPRKQDIYSGFSLLSLGAGLLGRDQTLHAVNAMPDVVGFWRGISHGMNETGTYVGILPLLLAVAGMMVGWRATAATGASSARSRLALLGVLFICVWLSFGTRAEPLSLWTWLHELPVFSTMRVPERFRLIFLLGVALFAGWGLERVMAWANRLRPPAGAATGMVVVGVVLVDLLLVVAPLMDQTFTIRPITMPPAPGRAFVQTAQHYPIASGRWAVEGDDTLLCTWSSHLPALYANQGIVFGNEEIPVPMKAVPVEDSGYRGEVFLYGTTGEARYVRWSPNVLRVNVRADDDGVVVFNQNYMTGWQVRGGGRVVEPVGGLLAVKVGPADRDVEIFYRPRSVLLGAAVSLLTLVALGAWWWRGARGK